MNTPLQITDLVAMFTTARNDHPGRKSNSNWQGPFPKQSAKKRIKKKREAKRNRRKT